VRRPEATASEAGGLVLREVVAGYGARTVLDGVSVRSDRGEVVGLIGPNGSGKTTIVRVAARGLRPRSGSVSVAGQDPYRGSARQAARLMAVVPQDVAPAFEFTVLEMVLLGRAPHRSPWGGAGGEDWGRVREAMHLADVQHLGDRFMGSLSGGERQRVILAQALAQDAPVLVLDEPTTHLDLSHVVGMLGLVRRLAREEGKAVLAVFHDLNLAAAYCDRVYALDRGRIMAEGRPASVITHDLVASVFGVEAAVGQDPSTGLPTVLPGPEPAPWPRSAARAHVVGGAGRGAGAMRLLAELGFAVSCGVLHATDTDALVSERLGLVRVTVPAFSSVGDEDVAECAPLLAAARVVVVADPPFGPGNVANLRMALRAAEVGVPIVLLDREPVGERDFTDGVASELWARLSSVAAVVRTEEELAATVAGVPR